MKQPINAMIEKARFLWRRLATIVLLGPLIGSLVYAFAALFFAPEPVSLGDSVALGLLIVIFGYAIGLVPALIAAIVWQFVYRPHRVLLRTALAALVGALSALVGITVLAPLLDLSWPEPGILAVIALCGAIALVITTVPPRAKAPD